MKPLFFSSSTRQNDESQMRLAALDKSQAVIEFLPGGTIITANANFLGAVGYTLDEVKGKHHSMFAEPKYKESVEYREFWETLRSGKFQSAQYKRLAKGGREIWIEASYNPLIDSKGNVFKVVKYATDITAQKLKDANNHGQIEAIHKSLAVIEFNMDGTIVTANANFLSAVGYMLDEIKGQHHSMFAEPAYHDSHEYKVFWETLGKGEYQTGRYKRIAKGGREIFIEASYNPILDMNGHPFKVVKFATDITKQAELLANLTHLFTEIDHASNQAAHQANNASRGAEEASGNVQTVTSASEKLAASTREISESMMRSRGATDDVYEQANTATSATGKLFEAAKAMDGIVSLIQNIASKINLLSLNATIEAARAGEAGRGFAVVANEVKNLATQAAQATEQISQEIGNIQTISKDVVGALQSINGSVEQVREYVSVTAAAVEEQSAVTQDMSSNMQSASAGVNAVSENIQEISSAINQIAQSISNTREASQALAG